MSMRTQEFKSNVIRKIKERFDVNERGSHHIFYEIYYKGKRVAKTRCSCGSSGRDIAPGALSTIKRQLWLDNSEQLQKLGKCSWEGKDYYNLLKQKNVISD